MRACSSIPDMAYPCFTPKRSPPLYRNCRSHRTHARDKMVSCVKSYNSGTVFAAMMEVILKPLNQMLPDVGYAYSPVDAAHIRTEYLIVYKTFSIYYFIVKI